MRGKLKLDLDRLEVESFETEKVLADQGTVHAHGTVRCSVNPDYTCVEETCAAVVTCLGETCGGCDTAWKCTVNQTDDCTFYCVTGGTSCYPSQAGADPNCL